MFLIIGAWFGGCGMLESFLLKGSPLSMLIDFSPTSSLRVKMVGRGAYLLCKAFSLSNPVPGGRETGPNIWQ